MLVFPQLVTGASALYPVMKTSMQRTVVNTLADGSTLVFPDPEAATLEWELQAQGMTRAEWNAIEALFDAVSGRWQTFTLLDPAGNLLEQSENFAAGAWAKGASIQLTGAIDDPLGTARATRVVNAGQGTLGITQTLAAPGNFQYCLSVWARTTAGSSVTLSIATVEKTLALTGQWTRISLAANPGQSTEAVMFGAQFAAGATVDLFGMQAEAQLAPSDYKMTTARGGVYSNARFAEDQITVTAQGTDVHDAVIRIVNTGS